MRGAAPLLLAVTCAATGVEVKLAPTGTIDIEATAAPLSDIVECLARRTGMKVVSDGTPRQPVTVSLHNVTQAEAIYNLFEGSGVAYALSLDPTGTRVLSLLVTYGGKSTGAGPAAATPPRAAPPRAPMAEPPSIPDDLPATGEESDTARPPSNTQGPLTAPASPPSTPGLPLGPVPPQFGPLLFPPAGRGSPSHGSEVSPGQEPELFPDQRSLSPSSLRDAGRVGPARTAF